MARRRSGLAAWAASAISYTQKARHGLAVAAPALLQGLRRGAPRRLVSRGCIVTLSCAAHPRPDCKDRLPDTQQRAARARWQQIPPHFFGGGNPAHLQQCTVQPCR